MANNMKPGASADMGIGLHIDVDIDSDMDGSIHWRSFEESYMAPLNWFGVNIRQAPFCACPFNKSPTDWDPF